MIIPRFLYRGESDSTFEKNKGQLLPKFLGKPFSGFARCGDDYANCGSGVICGLSFGNEVLRHEYKQNGGSTSGISTTPHIERAKDYAFGKDQKQSGKVFKIDRAKFKKYGVLEYQVSKVARFPSVPEDDEVILVSEDFGVLPKEIIVSIIDVCPYL